MLGDVYCAVWTFGNVCHPNDTICSCDNSEKYLVTKTHKKTDK